MNWFARLLRKISGRFRREAPPRFSLDLDTFNALHEIAQREHRSIEEIAERILKDAAADHQTQLVCWEYWQLLTPRQQQVTALVCLNYTTRQIAAKLFISEETVKTHVEHILNKFGVVDRKALRILLSSWDFSAFEQ